MKSNEKISLVMVICMIWIYRLKCKINIFENQKVIKLNANMDVRCKTPKNKQLFLSAVFSR